LPTPAEDGEQLKNLMEGSNNLKSRLGWLWLPGMPDEGPQEVDRHHGADDEHYRAHHRREGVDASDSRWSSELQ
jgi:hypothetical protein